MKTTRYAVVTVWCAIAMAVQGIAFAAEPLPSWNDGPARQAILAFVAKVTENGSPDFVPPAERIAVFDNDGTLWSEQPLYFQLLYAFDMVRKMAPQHPEWQDKEPFASIVRGDLKHVLEGGKEELLEVLAVAHAGMTVDDFADNSREWLATARHPQTGMAYTDMVYQPMLELLDYLRANGFKTFIVSGGGIDFMRVFSEEVYGIAPEQVIGSSVEAAYEVRDGVPRLMKVAKLAFYDDKEGKPVGIHQHIGRRPIFAGGNSDGDFQMLEWTTTGSGPRFGLLVHHTDQEREWAYDRESHIGKLARGLDEAGTRGWSVVDMKRDWKTIYPAP